MERWLNVNLLFTLYHKVRGENATTIEAMQVVTKQLLAIQNTKSLEYCKSIVRLMGWSMIVLLNFMIYAVVNKEKKHFSFGLSSL